MSQEIANLSATIGADVSGFTRGASQTQSSLRGISREMQATQAKFASATSTLEQMEAAYAAATQHTQAETSALEQQRAKVAQLTEELQRHNDAAGKASQAQGIFKSAMDGLASAFDKARGANEEFNQEFESGFRKIQSVASGAFSVINGNYEALGQILGALPGPIGTVGEAIGSTLGRIVSETGEYVHEMQVAATATGTTVSFMSQFVEAADDQAVSQEAVTTGLTKFARSLDGVIDIEGGVNASGKGVTQTLNELGIATEDAGGKAKTLQQLLPDIADKFQQMGPSAKTAALAVQLFGKQGTELLPALTKGWKTLSESMKGAADTGLAITDETAKAFGNLRAAQDAAADSQKGLERQLAGPLASALTFLFTTINAGIQNIQQFGGAGGEAVDVGKQLAETYQTAQERIDAETQAQAAATSAAQSAAGSIAALTDSQRSLVGATYANIDATSAFDNYLQQLDEDTIRAQNSTEGYADWVAKSATATAGASAGITAYNMKLTENVLAAKQAAEAEEGFKHQMDLVFGAATHAPEAMDKAAKAQLALKLVLAGQKELEAGDIAGAEAAKKRAVADAETTLAAQALFKAYDKGKISLSEYAQAEAELGKGNAAQVFFALKEAGVAADPALLKMVQDLRGVEAAVGVADQSMISGLDTLHARTTATKAVATSAADATAAMDNWVKATAAQNTAQEQNNTTLKDTREQYSKGAATAEQLAQAQINASLSADQHRKATNEAKEAYDKANTSINSANNGLVYHTRIVDTASGSAQLLATNVHNIPDAMDKAAASTGKFDDALGKVPAEKKVDIAVNLPSEVTQHLFDNAPPLVLPPEVTMHLFDNFASGASGASGAIKTGLLDPLQRTIQDQLGNLGGSNGATNLGSPIAEGIAAGITASQPLAIGATEKLATDMQTAFKTSWGIKSPSSVAEGYATQIDQGLANGVTGGMKPVMESFTGVKTAFTNTITEMVNAVKETSQWRIAGLQVDTTLAQSIRDNAIAVTSALNDIIQAAIKNALAGIGVNATGTGGAGGGGVGAPPGGGGGGAISNSPTLRAQVPINIHIGTRQIQNELADMILDAVTQAG